MFDLPDAKRVRRSDLYARSHSVSPSPSDADPELEAELHARLASIYGPLSEPLALDTIQYDGAVDVVIEEKASSDHVDQEFEFRLFSTSGAEQLGNPDETVVPKVVLGEEEEDGDGRFVVRERNRKYYFIDKADGERQLGFEMMALSGEEILSRARKRAWGLEVPWRVQVIKSVLKGDSRRANEFVRSVEGDEDNKRRRPGKKRRIILRERQRLRKKLQQQKKAEIEEKEEAERQKRTRRNREKKVKKKMKEKAKKTGHITGDAITGDASTITMRVSES